MHVITGVIVAEVGPFASNRGQFTGESLSRIITLMRGIHLPVYLGHESVSILGVLRGPRRQAACVTADLHVSPFAKSEHVDIVQSHAYLTASGWGLSLELLAQKLTDTWPPTWLPSQLLRCAVEPHPDSTCSLRLEPRELEESLSELFRLRERADEREGLLRIERSNRVEHMVPPTDGGGMTVRELYERGGRRPAAQQVVYGPKAGSFV